MIIVRIALDHTHRGSSEVQATQSHLTGVLGSHVFISNNDRIPQYLATPLAISVPRTVGESYEEGMAVGRGDRSSTEVIGVRRSDRSSAEGKPSVMQLRDIERRRWSVV